MTAEPRERWRREVNNILPGERRSTDSTLLSVVFKNKDLQLLSIYLTMLMCRKESAHEMVDTADVTATKQTTQPGIRRARV